MNGVKVVRHEILYQNLSLKFCLKNTLTELWSRGEAYKVNAEFVFSVSKSIEKQSFSNFLSHYQHEKKIEIMFKKVNFK